MRETSLVISLKTGSNTIYEVRDEKVERWDTVQILGSPLGKISNL